MEAILLQRPKPLSIRATEGVAPDHLEHRILCAYVQLAMTPERADGTRSATLTRFGALEVRLTECAAAEGLPDGVPPFWLEIYSCATRSTIDSYGCFEFDEDELACAVELMEGARMSVRSH
jgi:hypothetical protein